MEQRINLQAAEPGIYQAMFYAEKIISRFDLPATLKILIYTRVSQINGCGYCIDSHTREARKLGESEQRLYTLSAWWETPFFSEAEQAALRLAEEVTRIGEHGVSEPVYSKALHHFGEKKTAQIIFTAIQINSWNRLAISAHKVAEANLDTRRLREKSGQLHGNPSDVHQKTSIS